MYEADEGKEFFEQLKVFTDRVLVSLNFRDRESEWGSTWRNNGPDGAVIHYTADPDPIRVLKWFIETRFRSKSSAHCVVFVERVTEWDGFLADLPLIAALPVTVVQARPHTLTANHATWANSTMYGIEIVNPGEIKERDGSFFWYLPRDIDGDGVKDAWGTPWSGEVVEAAGRYWSPYPRAQIEATTEILLRLDAIYQLDPVRILGHEQVQGVNTLSGRRKPMAKDKRDPGPLFPLHEVRQAVKRGLDLNAIELTSVSELETMAGSIPLEESMRKLRLDWRDPKIVQCALYALGYYIGRFGPELSIQAKDSVGIFQKMSGLRTDGVVGPMTAAALSGRYFDRFS